jgi:hypothetical protein
MPKYCSIVRFDLSQLFQGVKSIPGHVGKRRLMWMVNWTVERRRRYTGYIACPK